MRRLSKYTTLLHKWLALAVGVQVVLWFLSGLVMTWLDVERVRGERSIRIASPAPFIAVDRVIPPNEFLTLNNISAEHLKLRRLRDKMVYEVKTLGGEVALYDAFRGHKISPLSANLALEIALDDFAPPSHPSAPQWLKARNTEYRAELPVWRVDMHDKDATHIYISPTTGYVLARRTALWRVYDFFWMLHIMDYDTRSDFNHPLIVWTAIFGVVLAITGAILVVVRFRKKDFFS